MEYSPDDIEALTAVQALRERPQMYGVGTAQDLVTGLLEDLLDEARGGSLRHATLRLRDPLTIDLRAVGVCADHGPSRIADRSLLELCFGVELYACLCGCDERPGHRRPLARAHRTDMGTLNGFCHRFRVASWDGREWRAATWIDGETQGLLIDHEPSPDSPEPQLRLTAEIGPSLLPDDAPIDAEATARRLAELAALTAGPAFTLVDERRGRSAAWTAHAPDGLAALLGPEAGSASATVTPEIGLDVTVSVAIDHGRGRLRRPLPHDGETRLGFVGGQRWSGAHLDLLQRELVAQGLAPRAAAIAVAAASPDPMWEAIPSGFDYPQGRDAPLALRWLRPTLEAALPELVRQATARG